MAIQDKKHWSTKSEAARDEVKDAVEEAFTWVFFTHRRQAALSLGGVAAVALLGGLLLYSRQAKAASAWDKLSRAEAAAYSGRPQDAQTLLAEVSSEGGSRGASTLAHMLDGDILYTKYAAYDKALAAYDQAVQEAPEALRPFAVAEKVMALEAAGKTADCAAAAQSFLDGHADHLLTAQVHAALARCQSALGQADAAKATLQRISLQYPNTSWAAWASSRLQAPH